MCSATFEMYNGCLGFIWNYFCRYRQKQTKQLAMLCLKHLLTVNFLFIKRLYKIALSSNSACLRGPFYECQAVRNVIDRALALCHSSFNYILLMRPNRKTVTVTKVFWRSIGFFHGSKGEFGWTLGSLGLKYYETILIKKLWFELKLIGFHRNQRTAAVELAYLASSNESQYQEIMCYCSCFSCHSWTTNKAVILLNCSFSHYRDL